MVTQEEAIHTAFPGDEVDVSTFSQILEMDDEGDHEFSRGIVFDFFGQAENTFSDIEGRLSEKNLEELSKLGHFLKGSSATLGITYVRDACERIQNYGLAKDEKGEPSKLDKAQLLAEISKAFTEAKDNYSIAKMRLEKFYDLVEGKEGED